MVQIDILGTTYHIEEDPNLVKDEGADGICARYTKTIYLAPKDEMLSDCKDEKEKQARYDEVVRHEVIHAFLFESGADRLAQDEDLVQFLAVQAPKLFELFKRLEVDK